MSQMSPIQAPAMPAMSAPAMGAPMFSARRPQPQKDTVAFGHRQPAPQFGGVFMDETGEPRYGRIVGGAAAAVALLLSPFALFEKVDSTERCAYKNTITGNVSEVDGGLIFAPWGVMKEGQCFPTNDPRVTEHVYGLSSDGIKVDTPVSVGWKVTEGHVAQTFLEAYGRGGTGDRLIGPEPNSEGSKAQIPSDAMDALYENVMYTEFRSMIGDLQALIPASQLHTQAAKQAINDAITNGYKPSDIYNSFKDFQITVAGVEGEENSRLNQLLSSDEQPSLQERITDRYGVPVITITNVDARDSVILDEEYKAALQALGRYPTLQREAEQKKELNRLEGLANLEKAAAEAAVQAQLAEGEAQAIEIVGEAIRSFPEALQDKYAEGFKIAAENGNLIITDQNGGNPIIIDGSRFQQGQGEGGN